MLKKNHFQNLELEVGYPFNIIYNHSPCTFPLHWHHYVEIIIPFQESVQYEISGHIYSPEPEDILFIWSGELHALIHQPQPSHVLLLQFDYSVIGDRIDFRDKLYWFHRLHMIKSAENPELSASLKEKLAALKELFSSCDPFKEVKMCMELYQFFMALGNHLLSVSFSLPSERRPNLNQMTERMISVCSYLSNHCTEDIPLGVAAEYAGFSRSYFSRLFQKFTTCSYPGFITKERLRKAEELLTNLNLTITEASFQSGFNSITTFNRVFRKYKHCSPTEFRKLYYASHASSDSFFPHP